MAGGVGRATIQIKQTSVGELPVAAVGKPFSGGVGKSIIAAIRASIRAEFEGQYWHSPSGSKYPWRDYFFGRDIKRGESPKFVKYKMDRIRQSPGGRATLKDGQKRSRGRKTYGLFDAWMGANSHGRAVASATQVEVAVVGIPYAAVHRGGSGASGISRDPTYIQASARGIYASIGLWPTQVAQGDPIELWPRPHATKNPELIAKIKRIVIAGIGGRARAKKAVTS